MKLLSSATALVLAALALGGCAATESAARRIDTVYVNGTVITANDKDDVVQAVAVGDGKIVAVGTSAEIRKLAGPSTRVVDLSGKTMLPGFIDAHGHVVGVGIQSVAANLLPPPDGPSTDVAALQATLREYAETATAKNFGWILGMGYDDAQLREQRHPTKEELDAVSRDVPILVMHQSGHLAVANSKALELAGVTAQSKDPEGGVIRRKAGTAEPDGVLEETALHILLGALPKVTDEQNVQLAIKGAEIYARFGFTTAQDGRTAGAQFDALCKAARAGKLVIDVGAYPDNLAGPKALGSDWPSKNYEGHLRLAGVKLSLDGSVQGKTGWLTQPYFKPPPGQPADYIGYPTFADQSKVDAFVDEAFAKRQQVLAHCGGDAAAEQFIHAVRAATEKYGKADRRPVMIHAHVLSEAQLDAMHELGIIPSFFPGHTYYWGDWHRDSVLGPERAAQVEAAGSALRRGMIFTGHHDAPVTFPDAMRIISSFVTRVTRSGKVLGPDQRVSPMVAIKAVTIWSAYQYFEENTKGSIEVGKLADFVVLAENPLTVDPMKLASIVVLQTIKEDVTVYDAKAEKPK